MFIKKLSVFRNWTDDDEAANKAMLEADNKYSKINRVVKDETEYADLMQFMLENYQQIREIFDFYAAASNFPSIGWLDFTEICNITKLIDKRNLNTSVVD